MPQTIITKHSTTPDKIPLSSDLVTGELALNAHDCELFAKDTTNKVRYVTGRGYAEYTLKAGTQFDTLDKILDHSTDRQLTTIKVFVDGTINVTTLKITTTNSNIDKLILHGNTGCTINLNDDLSFLNDTFISQTNIKTVVIDGEFTTTNGGTTRSIAFITITGDINIYIPGTININDLDDLTELNGCSLYITGTIKMTGGYSGFRAKGSQIHVYGADLDLNLSLNYLRLRGSAFKASATTFKGEAKYTINAFDGSRVDIVYSTMSLILKSNFIYAKRGSHVTLSEINFSGSTISIGYTGSFIMAWYASSVVVRCESASPLTDFPTISGNFMRACIYSRDNSHIVIDNTIVTYNNVSRIASAINHSHITLLFVGNGGAHNISSAIAVTATLCSSIYCEDCKFAGYTSYAAKATGSSAITLSDCEYSGKSLSVEGGSRGNIGGSQGTGTNIPVDGNVSADGSRITSILI